MVLENPISRSGIKNHLGLFMPNGEVDWEKTCAFAGITIEKAWAIFKVPPKQGRTNPPARFGVNMRELATCLEFVAETFDGNKELTKFWWNTPNPNFDGLSPSDLVTHRYHKRVFDFVLDVAREKLGQ